MENPDEQENKQAEPALSQAIKKSKMKKKKAKKLSPKQKALVSLDLFNFISDSEL